MTTIRLAASGGRDAADSWERYALPSRWSEWSPQIRRAESSSPRLAAGVTGRVIPLVGPGLPFEVTAYDETGRTWSWTVHLGPASLHLDHAVTGRPDGSGSRTTLVLRGPAPLTLPYAPLALLALRRLVAAA